MITSLFKIYAIKFFSGSNFNTERFFSLSNSGFGLDRIGLIDSKTWTIICFIRICFFDKFHFDKMD
jgi:hypothetical protein